MTWKSWNGAKAKAIAAKAGLEALRDVGETVLTKAQNTVPLAPDGGTLRRSGTVTVGGLPDGASVYAAAESGQNMNKAFSASLGTEKSVYVSYNTPYGLRMHEGVIINEYGSFPVKNWSEPGTGPKYLENALNAQKPKAIPYVGKMVQKALERA